MPVLAEVLDAGEDLGPSFFEVTIAAAFSEFARVPADACVVEVGLGGRFDATNVLEPESVAACGIASLGIDHERLTYRFQGRYYRLTDIHGNVVKDILS